MHLVCTNKKKGSLSIVSTIPVDNQQGGGSEGASILATNSIFPIPKLKALGPSTPSRPVLLVRVAEPAQRGLTFLGTAGSILGLSER
jgi:hypothetical protein